MQLLRGVLLQMPKPKQGGQKKAARMGCNEMQNGGSNEQYIYIYNNNSNSNNIYIYILYIYDYIMSLCHVTTNLTQ